MIKNESALMRFFRFLGLDSISWSLRRLHCPVNSNDLVLEVGSGGNPYYRANVLLDAFFETQERHWEPLIADRPIVLGYGENLPFKDKSFDFIIASHVLEHSAQPEKFLAELMRVGKAGYIEVPDAFMERLNPYIDHRLEITIRDEKLLIRKKKKAILDSELYELYISRKANDIIAGKTIPRNPFHFHVRYYWQRKIDYEIINPSVKIDWIPDSSSLNNVSRSMKSWLKGKILIFLRLVFSQSRRNKRLNIKNLIQCPRCGSHDMLWMDSIACNNCKSKYNLRNGIPDFSI